MAPMTKGERDRDIHNFKWMVNTHTHALAVVREQSGYPLTGMEKLAVINHYVPMIAANTEFVKALYYADRNERRPAHRHLMKALKEVRKVEATRQVFDRLPAELDEQYMTIFGAMANRGEIAMERVYMLMSPLSQPGDFKRFAESDGYSLGMFS